MSGSGSGIGQWHLECTGVNQVERVGASPGGRAEHVEYPRNDPVAHGLFGPFRVLPRRNNTLAGSVYRRVRLPTDTRTK